MTHSAVLVLLQAPDPAITLGLLVQIQSKGRMTSVTRPCSLTVTKVWHTRDIGLLKCAVRPVYQSPPSVPASPRGLTSPPRGISCQCELLHRHHRCLDSKGFLPPTGKRQPPHQPLTQAQCGCLSRIVESWSHINTNVSGIAYNKPFKNYISHDTLRLNWVEFHSAGIQNKGFWIILWINL